jgi:hypothetical protein
MIDSSSNSEFIQNLPRYLARNWVKVLEAQIPAERVKRKSMCILCWCGR